MRQIFQQYLKIHDQTRMIVNTCIYGLVASLAAVGFQLLIHWLFQFVYLSQTGLPFWKFAGLSLLAIVVSSLIVGWLLNAYCPEAAGSGIPQVKLAYWKEFGHSPVRIAVVKFIAGIIGIGGGQSLGREGPTVQLGSNLASNAAGLLGVAKQNRRVASAAGAAAGLAAAFNSPLAAVAFVLEEIIGDLNSRSIGPVLLASLIGAFVVHACIGPQPTFELPVIDEPSWSAYLLMPVAAALAALTGVFFQRACLTLRARSRAQRVIPKWLHPLGGGLATWVIGISVFAGTGRLGIFGLGYEDLSDALAHGIAWQLALILLLGKLSATIISYSLGGCGGIFSPNLFFGAMCGALVAGLASQFMPLHQADTLLITIGAMSACLGAVVQAPVTSILIIFEMTHQFALVPGLMLAGIVSQVIARLLNHANFYEAVLHQDGHRMEHIVPPRDLRTWHNLPVSAIASFAPVAVEDQEQESLVALLEQHPYRHFPVVRDGVPQGIARREAIQQAVRQQAPLPPLVPIVTCRPGQTIQEVQKLLLDSATGTVLLTDTEHGHLLGIITLHDLLRTQLAVTEGADGTER